MTGHKLVTKGYPMASIRKRNGKWQVQVRRTGHKGQTKSFQHKEDALKWARTVSISLDRAAIEPQSNGLQDKPLSELIERYEREISRHKAGHHIEVYILKKWLRRPIADKQIYKIRKTDLLAELDRQRGLLKAATLQKEFSLLRHVFNTAIALWDLQIHTNPFEGLKLPRVHAPTIQRIDAAAIDKIADYFASKPNAQLHRVIVFALETAMRRSEILNLKWEDIDRQRRLARITKSKNNEQRFVPLTRAVFDLLEQQDPQTEYVFTMTANAVRLGWQRMRSRIDIPHIRFHDLRHEAISRFFDRGLTVPEVASISGHKTVSMLFRYAHADTAKLVEKLYAG